MSESEKLIVERHFAALRRFFFSSCFPPLKKQMKNSCPFQEFFEIGLYKESPFSV